MFEGWTLAAPRHARRLVGSQVRFYTKNNAIYLGPAIRDNWPRNMARGKFLIKGRRVALVPTNSEDLSGYCVKKKNGKFNAVGFSAVSNFLDLNEDFTVTAAVERHKGEVVWWSFEV